MNYLLNGFNEKEKESASAYVVGRYDVSQQKYFMQAKFGTDEEADAKKYLSHIRRMHPAQRYELFFATESESITMEK